MKKLLALVLIALVSLPGCASLGGAKQAGFQGYAVAHTSFMLTKNVEADLVCGRSPAPPAPLCVDDATHGKILDILHQASIFDGDLGRAIQAMPEGVATTPEVGTLIGKITALISDVLALIPKSPQKAALAEKVQVK